MEDDKIQRKMKKLYKHVKSGRLTEEIADEISELMEHVENMGEDAKRNISGIVNDMKSAMKKMK